MSYYISYSVYFPVRCLGLPRLLALVNADDDDTGLSCIPRLMLGMFNEPWPEYLDVDLACAPAAVAVGQSSSTTTRLKAHMFLLAAYDLSPTQFETIPVDFAHAILCFVYTERLPSDLRLPTKHWIAFAETVSALGLYSLAAVASDRVMSRLSEKTWATLAIETEGSQACKVVHAAALGCGVTEATLHVRHRMNDLGWFTEPEDLNEVEPRVEKLLGALSTTHEQVGFLRKRRPGLYNELKDSVSGRGESCGEWFHTEVSSDVKKAVQAELVVMQHISYYDKLSKGDDGEFERGIHHPLTLDHSVATSASSGPEFHTPIIRCVLELLALVSVSGVIVTMVSILATARLAVEQYEKICK